MRYESSDGVVVVRDGTCVFTNDQFVSITGYDRDALAGQPFTSLVVPGDREVVQERYAKRLRGESTPDQYEVGIETSEGDRRTVELSIARIEHDGDPAALVNVRDVTERRQREQRLEVFNRVLRHNLRNQIDVIRSHAEVMRDRTGDAHANEILASTDRLALIGNRARTIDRIVSRDCQYTRVELGALLDEVVRAPDIGDDRTVQTEVAGEGVLVTDRWVLRTVLESLLESARRYGETAVTVRAEPVADGYRVAVEDDGPGIPADELAALEAGTETNLQHSRGLLGLWQLKWGVDTLGGDLSFETASGTTVRIDVPDRGDSVDGARPVESMEDTDSAPAGPGRGEARPDDSRR